MNRSKVRSVFLVAAAAVLACSLSSCASESGGAGAGSGSGGAGTSSPTSEAPIGGDVIAPVTMNLTELQGATVELVVGQVLNIDTESHPVEAFTAQVSDAKVAEFTPGRKDDSATFNPGLTALAEGSTNVTLQNEQGGAQPLEFAVVVSAR